MFERPKRRIPSLNTTSTADISFMLLIFFLVTSSMDTDKGLPRQLPPMQDEQTEQMLQVKERNVLRIRIDSSNAMTCNDEAVTPELLTERIKTFVANKGNASSLPEKSRREVNFFGICEVSDRHILSIHVDRETSYNAYFQMQNAIVKAYAQLRNELAKKKFGRPLAKCSQEEREAIGMVYPQRISEELPATDKKGGQQ